MKIKVILDKALKYFKEALMIAEEIGNKILIEEFKK